LTGLKTQHNNRRDEKKGHRQKEAEGKSKKEKKAVKRDYEGITKDKKSHSDALGGEG